MFKLNKSNSGNQLQQEKTSNSVTKFMQLLITQQKVACKEHQLSQASHPQKTSPLHLPQNVGDPQNAALTAKKEKYLISKAKSLKPVYQIKVMDFH